MVALGKRIRGGIGFFLMQLRGGWFHGDIFCGVGSEIVFGFDWKRGGGVLVDSVRSGGVGDRAVRGRLGGVLIRGRRA